MKAVSVTFLPMGESAAVRKGKTLLDAARELNLRLTHECDGKLTCGTCVVEIEDGADALPKASAAEREHLERQGLAGRHRLSCQLMLAADIVVRLKESNR